MKRKREVTVHIANLIRMGSLEFKRSQTGTGAVWALEIGIFNQRHDRVFRTDCPVIFRNFTKSSLYGFVFHGCIHKRTLNFSGIGNIRIPDSPFVIRGRCAASKDEDK